MKYFTTRIDIFGIYMIYKELNMSLNVFVPMGNITGIGVIDASHILLKRKELNLPALELFIQI